MTVRRDTSKGLDQATSFVVFTTESGRILLSSGLTSQSLAKEVQHPLLPPLPLLQHAAAPQPCHGWHAHLSWSGGLLWSCAGARACCRRAGLNVGCAMQTAKPTMRIMGVHKDGKFQLALLKFKTGSEAVEFAKHVAEHRPKA